MSATYQIPVNKKVTQLDQSNLPIHVLPPVDRALIASCSPVLRDHAEISIRTINSEMNSSIEKYYEKKKTYCSELENTYAIIKDAIKTAFESKGKLDISITGKYSSSYQCPTKDYWITCNPAKWAAIEAVIVELKIAGWSPMTKISDYKYDNDEADYYQGNELIITCNFDHA
jgi:hypothetical protein